MLVALTCVSYTLLFLHNKLNKVWLSVSQKHEIAGVSESFIINMKGLKLGAGFFFTL